MNHGTRIWRFINKIDVGYKRVMSHIYTHTHTPGMKCEFWGSAKFNILGHNWPGQNIKMSTGRLNLLNYVNICTYWLLLSREDGFFHLEPHLRIHDVKLEVVVEYWIWRCLIKKSMPDTVNIQIWQNNKVCCGQNICVLLHFCFFGLCPNPNILPTAYLIILRNPYDYCLRHWFFN